MRTEVFINGLKIAVTLACWLLIAVSLGVMFGTATYYVFEHLIENSTGCMGTYEWIP